MSTQFSIFEFLASRYPLLISAIELSEIVGDPIQTIRNGVFAGTYPIPSSKRGRRRVFSLLDVAQFVDDHHSARDVIGGVEARRRGRPTKVAQARRQGAAADGR